MHVCISTNQNYIFVRTRAVRRDDACTRTYKNNYFDSWNVRTDSNILRKGHSVHIKMPEKYFRRTGINSTCQKRKKIKKRLNVNDYLYLSYRST